MLVRFRRQRASSKGLRPSYARQASSAEGEQQGIEAELCSSGFVGNLRTEVQFQLYMPRSRRATAGVVYMPRSEGIATPRWKRLTRTCQRRGMVV